MQLAKTVGVLVVVLMLAASVQAHHASAGIDRQSTVTVEGVVKEFRWANPHCWIELEVERDGKTEFWNFEMLPPSFLVRVGWKRTSVTPGERVTVVANGFLNGDPGGLFVSMTRPDGTVLYQRPPRN